MAYFSSFIGRGFRLKYLACNKNYLDNSWLSSQTLPTSGAKTTYGYNTLRQKTDLLNASAAGVQISRFGDATDATAKLLYDGRGQLNRVRALLPDNLTNQTNYSYDAKGQLSFSRRYTSATAYTERTYQYDGAGNPTSWNGQTRTFNTLNQETTGGATQFAYDGNGSATKYRGRTRAYDVENRLTQVNSESGALLLKSGYRWDGKRAWKENGNGFRTYTFYDGDQTLFDVSESNQVLELVAWGANGVLEWSQVDSTKQPLWDARGNMSQLLDATGNLITTFDTDAWGNITRSNTAATDGYGAQWGYRTDVETGYILCTHRYYDPAGGRWLTREPIEYSGGMNLYGYVTNNPTNAVDPSGLVRVEIHTRSVTGPFGVRTGGDHTFILVWETNRKGMVIPNQTPYMFAAYNHPGKVGTPGNGKLSVRGGSSDRTFDDFHYLPGGKDSKYYNGIVWQMFDPNKCAAQVFKSLKRVKDSLNKSNWNYSFAGIRRPNSNTAIFTMIQDGLGLTPSLDADGAQPGFNSIRRGSYYPRLP